MSFNSSVYWENRYLSGGNSGAGSYNHLAIFKAAVINSFIKKNNVKSLIDFGVGDGNQLKLIDTSNIKYYGIDISPTIIKKCQLMFPNDDTKSFYVNNDFDYNNIRVDLSISCDVLYHLIESDVYESYINNLFNLSEKFVIIYAKDFDQELSSHVKFRKFTHFIKKNYSEWILINHINNKYPNDSPSDFFIYEKTTILNKWYNFIEQHLLPLMGPSPEGNIYSSHLTTRKNDLMLSKQKNFVEFFSNFNGTNVLEIGFNGGFSALLIKLTNPYIKLTCIDINEHQYIIPCHKTLSEFFYDMELLTCSSLVALPQLISQNIVYDAIHIDGDHSLEGATKDLELCLKLSKKGTVIIFDDTNLSYLDKLCTSYVNKKIVREFIFNKTPGNKYEHRFLEVL